MANPFIQHSLQTIQFFLNDLQLLKAQHTTTLRSHFEVQSKKVQENCASLLHYWIEEIKVLINNYQNSICHAISQQEQASFVCLDGLTKNWEKKLQKCLICLNEPADQFWREIVGQLAKGTIEKEHKKVSMRLKSMRSPVKQWTVDKEQAKQALVSIQLLLATSDRAQQSDVRRQSVAANPLEFNSPIKNSSEWACIQAEILSRPVSKDFKNSAVDSPSIPLQLSKPSPSPILAQKILASKSAIRLNEPNRKPRRFSNPSVSNLITLTLKKRQLLRKIASQSTIQAPSIYRKLKQ